MIILALDTATDACSAALAIDGNITEQFEIAPRKHTQLILPMIKKLLSDTNVKLADVNAIAFGRGPGSFTGVRIATSVAQGLAFAETLPVIPVSTLCAMAQGAFEEFGFQQVAVALDARMSEVYWGEYHIGRSGCMELIGKESVCSPAAVPIINAEHKWGIGEGWEFHHDALHQRLGDLLQGIKVKMYPKARDVAELAIHAYRSGQLLSAEKALPIYLRDKII